MLLLDGDPLADLRAAQVATVDGSCDDVVMEGPNNVDWSDVNPPDEPVEPLTPATFVARLDALSKAVNALARLAKAFREQNPLHADGLS